MKCPSGISFSRLHELGHDGGCYQTLISPLTLRILTDVASGWGRRDKRMKKGGGKWETEGRRETEKTQKGRDEKGGRKH